MKKQFRSFEEARKFAKTSKIETGVKWKKLGKEDKLPKDIPNRPDHVYRNKGWKDWGDFLGTGFIHNKFRTYRKFNELKQFVHSLNLRNKEEWKNFCNKKNKPKDIPNRPDHVYRNKGWKDWGDFLGTGNISPTAKSLTWVNFDEAREFVHSLNLVNQDEWNAYCKSGNKPDNIPTVPNTAYQKRGWISMGDWLGTGRIANQLRKYDSYNDAKKFVHALNLKNQYEWRDFSKSKDKPDNIPANPEVYKNKGWKGWGDWLGTGAIATQNRKFRSFSDARSFAHRLKFRNREEWEKFSKSKNKPNDIPANPGLNYKKEWKSWGDFLGTGTIANQTISKNYLPFQEARTETRKIAKKYNLKSWADWYKAKQQGKIPDDIPLEPNRVYSKIKKKK